MLASGAYYADRLGLLSSDRWLSMDQLQHALLPIHVERGVNDAILIIAFSGGAQQLTIPVHQFFEITKTLGYSRILLRDKFEMHYHHGVDRKRRDWPSLLDYLGSQIEELAPQKVICIGTSSGGYAALVAGYYLGADYVHAFAAQTRIGVDPESTPRSIRAIAANFTDQRALFAKRWISLRCSKNRMVKRLTSCTTALVMKPTAASPNASPISRR